MVEIVLQDGDHTFDASAKEITLVAPYTTLSEGQILKIVNMTTGAVIYDTIMRKYPISISGAAITHTYDDTGMADADLLQVVIDVGGSSTPIYVTPGTPVSTVGDGRQTVTTPGTAVALAASTAIKEVTVTAELTNTGTITVGGSTVVDAVATRRGTPLYPGDSVTVASDNLAEVFIDAEVGTDGVTYQYLA